MAEAMAPTLGAQTPNLRIVSGEVVRTDHTTYTPEDAQVNYHRYKRDGATKEAPFFIVTGFAGIAEAYSPMCETMASLGEEVFVIDPVRSMPWRHEIKLGQIITAHKLASRGIRAVLADIHETHGVDKVDAVVHSKAGRDIMWSAHHTPERLRSITFAGAVGLGHNFGTIVGGVPGFLTEDGPSLIRGIPEDLKNIENAKQLIRYFAERPHRVIAEIAMIARADIRASIPLLEANDIKTAVLEFANDRLLPPEHTTAEIRELADYYTIFQAGQAGHGAPIDQAVAMAHELINIRDELHY